MQDICKMDKEDTAWNMYFGHCKICKKATAVGGVSDTCQECKIKQFEFEESKKKGVF